jgi:hypothetical protein
MVSLAAASLLMVAALGITTSLARSELMVRRQEAGPEHLRAAVESLVRRDLAHTRHWREAEGGFALQADIRLPAAGLRLEHVPMEVTYTVRPAGGRPALFRRQQAAGESATEELVALDVRRCTLQPARAVRPGPDGWRPMGGGYVVSVALGPEATSGADIEIIVPETEGD